MLANIIENSVPVYLNFEKMADTYRLINIDDISNDMNAPYSMYFNEHRCIAYHWENHVK